METQSRRFFVKRIKVTTMKALLSLVLAFASLSLMAQDRPQGERGPRQASGRQQWTVAQRAERETASIHNAVNLTDKQIEDVYQVTYVCALQDSIQMAEMRAQRQRGESQNFDREAFMKRYQEKEAAKKEALQKIFTKEQSKKYDSWMEEMAKQARERQQRHGQQGPREHQGNRR